MELPQQSYSRKNRKNLCLLPDLHCFVGGEHRFINLLLPIFLFPWQIQMLYIHSWLIGGPLGQTFCKLGIFLPDVSTAVSTQSLVLITADRFGAVVFPLRSPLISSKLCPFFILATWIFAIAVNSTEVFVNKFNEYPAKLFCEKHWNEVFGESSSLENYTMLTLDNNASKGREMC